MHTLKCSRSKLEHIINTDDSRKTELKKCCKVGKCYSKPPFLQNNDNTKGMPSNSCESNKKIASTYLEKSYEQMFSNDHYNMLLKDLKIRPNIDNTTFERAQKEISLEIRKIDDISKKIGTVAYNNILSDDTDNIIGYNKDNHKFALLK